ncbi:hypothetical protein [Acetobacterium bakii]|uniref:NADPH-dependent FMN reductase-like domain-containing protein n=1 Tax=Acetobacterium bakii TaxID=52689 RepID=A0A0L6U069_9FIRM|nr:hypothetical protein [Acetobacterium bakii]KNZ41894.1 hypothetical protein AKG39_09780 [Acetobacterium bakii]
MKKAVIINLSPQKIGTSAMLGKLCLDFLNKKGLQREMIHLYPHLKDLTPVLKAIDGADTVIMVGPCYIDTYPADTVYFLEEIIKDQTILHDQSLYGIIQGGMPYVHTHESGLKMLELFAKECNINYKGGFVIGLGAMLDGQSLDKLPNGKKVNRFFNEFLNHVAKGENSNAALYGNAQLKLPGFVYWAMAKGMNKMIDKELKEKDIDVTLPSPYLKSEQPNE